LKRSDHLSLLDLSFCEINNLGILGLSFHPSLKNLNLKGILIISNGQRGKFIYGKLVAAALFLTVTRWILTKEEYLMSHADILLSVMSRL
jgi:hypothetical protein